MRPKQFIEGGWIAILLASLVWAPSCSNSRASDAGSGSNQPPVAAVVKVTRRNLADRIEIASEFQPFQEVDIHAKVAGYVKNLCVDWGTHVKAGQLMAVLEVPELEQEVRHDFAAVQRSEQDLARANEDLRRAQSDYEVAHLTNDRLHGVQKVQPDLVAQEEIDVAQGKDRETQAATAAAQDQRAAAQHELAAAKATLGKDQAFYGYARITAPFRRCGDRTRCLQGCIASGQHLDQRERPRPLPFVPKRSPAPCHPRPGNLRAWHSNRRGRSGECIGTE